ncbi:cadherin domain-containing protein [Haliscomenobacter sp.]|uniref:cadherin repeat domain-containing protein n=1 Tax=Haliscomenobacter sp. TaxID=2717303 RepID=UPI0035948986
MQSRYLWILALMLVSVLEAKAYDKAPMANFGASNYPCNTKMPWVDSSFNGLSSSVIDFAADGLACIGSNTNLGNLRNNNLSDFASINFVSGLGGCSSTLSVVDTDVSDTYPVGTFAGYRVGTAGLVGISIGLNITISTYNGGSFVESQTVVSSGLGLNSSLINGDGTATLGFVTTVGAFDEIRITYTAAVALLFTGTVYHAVVQRYCAGPSLACNVQTRMNNPTFPTLISATNTGITGGVCVGCSVNNAENAVSNSTTDFATIVLTAALGTTGSIAVMDQLTDYPLGTFAGFDISNPNLVNANLLSGITIRTYKNGAPRETSNAATLLSVGSTLLTGAGKQTVGFVTTMDFDEVKIEVTNLLGVASTTNVYGAVFQSFCVGPDLPCNTLTSMATPAYPVLVAGPNTGTSGIACVLCSVDSTNNLIDNIPNNSARINLTAGVGSVGSIAVRDQLTDYPAGTFVAFDIENTAVVNVDLLAGLTISTYLNGNPVAVETKTGLAALLAVGTGLLTGNGRRTVGFVTAAPFDEVRLSVSNTLLVNVGITRVFNVFFEKFCPVVLECNTTNYLNGPDFPVIIDDSLSGVDGLTCVACSVQDAPYVITDDTTDFAVITTVIGALSPASIAVKDVLSTFPAGSTAGFVIRDVNTLLQLELFNSITITTYNNGIPQESENGSGLLDLAVLGLLNASLTGPGDFNIGFRTTLPYDEIQISVGSLASVINIIQVYGAFVDTRGANDGSLNCCPTTAPLLSANTISNTCPAVTVDLNSLVTNIPPMGADSTVVWFTNNGATGTAYPTPGAATAGTYYAFFYDTIDSCYGPASGAVTVTINTCPPVITSNGGGPTAAVSVPENTTAVTTVIASDPENGVVTYSITGGVDAALFAIDPMTGALTFNTPPDFENPTDAGGNNVYDVQVTATDPSNATDVQDIAVTVTDVDENGQLSVKVLLQGALFNSPTPGVMRDNLRSGNYIPLNDPYTASGNPRFAHAGAGGAASTTSGVLSANAGTDDAIVDWVFVELRSALDSTVVVETRAAMLQRDGDVVSPVDGISPLVIPGTAGNAYFVAVKHRNHLGIMTATEQTLTLAGTTVDFITMSDANVYNFTSPFSYDGAERVTINGFKALWAGNANADKKVKYQGPTNDNAAVLSQVLTFPGNTLGVFNYDLALGYFYGDLNLDGKVKYQGTTNDPGFMFLNLITNFVLNSLDLYNYDLFNEQIP